MDAVVETPTLTCGNCGEQINVSEAWRRTIGRQALEEERSRAKAELARATKQAEEEGRGRAAAEMTAKFELKNQEVLDLHKSNKQLIRELTSTVKDLGEARGALEAVGLRYEMQLQSSRDAIRTEERALAEERTQTRIMVLEKQVKDAEASAAEMQRQLTQRSQQTQGEVFQDQVDGALRQAFPEDDIEVVKTGQRGADIKQVVRTRTGAVCGTILWEAKNARWQGGWVGKLRADMRKAGADHAVLVSVNTPDVVGVVNNLEGTLWAARPAAMVGLAKLLRHSLTRTNELMAVALDRDQAIRSLQVYVTGPEFRHRMEVLKEFFEEDQREQDQEQQFFSKKWARQGKRRESVVENLLGLQGDFEGLRPPSVAVLEEAPGEQVAS